MAILDTEVKFLLSNKNVYLGYTSGSTGADSLGSVCSTTQVSATKNFLFDNVTGPENVSKNTEYRCVFLLNDNATLTYEDVVLYLAQVAGGTDISVAADNLPASIKTASTAQATSIVNEDTAPVGIGSFSAPTSAITGVSLGNIGPGQVKGFWVRREAQDTAALNDDGVTLYVSGDSPA